MLSIVCGKFNQGLVKTLVDFKIENCTGFHSNSGVMASEEVEEEWLLKYVTLMWASVCYIFSSLAAAVDNVGRSGLMADLFSGPAELLIT